MSYNLANFITESNYIEGRFCEPDAAEQNAYLAFLRNENMTLQTLLVLGQHIVPGFNLVNGQPLMPILANMGIHMHALRMGSRTSVDGVEAQRMWLAYTTHRAFMELQPFNGINGIIGRALWLWVMDGANKQTFLTEWYMQSLNFGGVAEIEKKPPPKFNLR